MNPVFEGLAIKRPIGSMWAIQKAIHEVTEVIIGMVMRKRCIFTPFAREGVRFCQVI
jgi:hypothetical protein